MYIECYDVMILRQWTADDGLETNTFVHIEFTLHDSDANIRRLRSKVVEFVSFRSDHPLTNARMNHNVLHRAVDQVRSYFNGEDTQDNIFIDRSEHPQTSWLSPKNEAELEAEFRTIEHDFASTV